MQRITITIDDDLAHEIDKRARSRGYQNRSEAVRDLVRAGIAQTRLESGGHGASNCVAALTYVYDQGTRDLPKRLGNAFRDHHDLSIATTRVALDHDSCLEVALLRGSIDQVEGFAQRIIAERGVRHGRVAVIPAEIDNERHAHGHGRARVHQHVRVL
jgi:CopG family transcriptional regulator, nickel-responsive regulator